VPWLLWLATGDRDHLQAARQRLDTVVAAVPERYSRAMCTNLRSFREVLAAWEAEFGTSPEPGPDAETWTKV
jgi:hypothetical protein